MTERGSFGIKERDPRLCKWRTVEALENLEYLSREGNKINESSLKSFDNIQGELQDASKNITKAYAVENEKSREQAAQIAAEAGFKMDQMSADITTTIGVQSELTREYIGYSTDRITESIDLAALQLGYEIRMTNVRLDNIHSTIKVSNQILSYIAGKLESIRHLMTIPNEVEALELADQARINFAIGKNDKALEITRKAMELCSTSIPVTAYHVIALASQNNGELFKETKTALKDYANLIAFKLQDKGSDEKLALLDTINMTYPVLHAVSKRYGAAMLDSAKDIYKSISVNKKAACGFVERGLIDDECAAMINAPTIFRELHWSTTLNVLTDTSVSLDNFSDNYNNKIDEFIKRVENAVK